MYLLIMLVHVATDPSQGCAFAPLAATRLLATMPTMLALALGSMLASPPAPATTLTVHRAFSSHMVLQAEAPVLFGTASPSSTVRVDGPNFMTNPVIADADGKWLVKLPQQYASDPMKPGIELAISDDRGAEVVKLYDVLFGDVRAALPEPPSR